MKMEECGEKGSTGSTRRTRRGAEEEEEEERAGGGAWGGGVPVLKHGALGGEGEGVYVGCVTLGFGWPIVPSISALVPALSVESLQVSRRFLCPSPSIVFFSVSRA